MSETFPNIRARATFFERNGPIVKIVHENSWETVLIFNARYCTSVYYRDGKIRIAIRGNDTLFCLDPKEYAGVLKTMQTQQEVIDAFLFVVEGALVAAGRKNKK